MAFHQKSPTKSPNSARGILPNAALEKLELSRENLEFRFSAAKINSQLLPLGILPFADFLRIGVVAFCRFL